MDLPLSKYYNEVFNLILVIVDRYTKMTKYIPTTKRYDAATLTNLFLEVIIYSFGVPKGIVSNRGLVFTSQF